MAYHQAFRSWRELPVTLLPVILRDAAFSIELPELAQGLLVKSPSCGLRLLRRQAESLGKRPVKRSPIVLLGKHRLLPRCDSPAMTEKRVGPDATGTDEGERGGYGGRLPVFFNPHLYQSEIAATSIDVASRLSRCMQFLGRRISVGRLVPLRPTVQIRPPASSWTSISGSND